MAFLLVRVACYVAAALSTTAALYGTDVRADILQETFIRFQVAYTPDKAGDTAQYTRIRLENQSVRQIMDAATIDRIGSNASIRRTVNGQPVRIVVPVDR